MENLFQIVYRNNKQIFGVETEYDLTGVATKIQNVDLKARLNLTQQKLGLSGKAKINNRYNWTQIY